MTFGVWLLGVIAFFIYDHIIGLGVDDNDFSYFFLAVFWFISIPVLIIRHLKNYLSRKS